VTFTVLTLIAVLLGITVVIFFVCASYSKRSTVSGQLVYPSGQLKIYSPQYGVVLESFISEGQTIRSGATLFRLSSERFTEGLGPVQAKIIAQLELRRLSLEEELGKQKQLHIDERQSLRSKQESLQKELIVLMRQAASQEKQVQLASNAADRYQKLMDKSFVSLDDLQQRQAYLLEQRQTLQRLNRETIALEHQLVEIKHELSSLSALQENQLAGIRRSLSSIRQELIESEAKRTFDITAPQDGIATAVLAASGQTVDSSRPLMSIVPADSRLRVELYAPSKAIGFIQEGDPVLLRYDAYPYQKFGQHPGVVASVSKVAISASHLAGNVRSVPGLSATGEQVYRIHVDIQTQSVMAYGRSRPLQAGMLVEADILLETRRLYEWVLEPLYSLSGNI
jgi:membrane fusion protein